MVTLLKFWNGSRFEKLPSSIFRTSNLLSLTSGFDELLRLVKVGWNTQCETIKSLLNVPNEVRAQRGRSE